MLVERELKYGDIMSDCQNTKNDLISYLQIERLSDKLFLPQYPSHNAKGCYHRPSRVPLGGN